MNRPVLFLSAFLAICCLASCTDEAPYTTQIAQMKDSIFKEYPTNVASVYIKVEDKTALKIVLGGEDLYKSAAGKQQQMASSLGQMAIRIFGKDSHLQTGQLILTKDERNSSDAPADGIAAPINIDSLKKAGGN